MTAGGAGPGEVGIGLLGHGFMGRAHASAYRTIRQLPAPPPARPRLAVLGGRRGRVLADAGDVMAFSEWTTDWRELVADDRVQVFDNCATTGAHYEPTIAAAQLGKHVLCEKPLGRDVAESFELWVAAETAGVRHMCGFNYRFVPAIRLARQLLEAGDLGEIHRFRGHYLQDWISDPAATTVWRRDRSLTGSGAICDLGAHIVDLARYLVGEPATVAATSSTFVLERPDGSIDVDDAVAAIVDFESGAIGAWEASRGRPGRRNSLTIEISGSRGSVAFDLERLNELRICIPAASGGGGAGFQTILVTEPEHPFMTNWWPPGHTLGWEHTLTHELAHFLSAVSGGNPVAPHGATFEDGYRAAEICDTIVRSARTGRHEPIAYRELTREFVSGALNR